MSDKGKDSSHRDIWLVSVPVGMHWSIPVEVAVRSSGDLNARAYLLDELRRLSLDDLEAKWLCSDDEWSAGGSR